MLKFLSQSYSQTVHFDCCVIPRTTVFEHRQVYDVTLLQQVYLQHGGIYYCRQYAHLHLPLPPSSL